MTFEAPRNAFFALAMPEFDITEHTSSNLILPQNVESLTISEEQFSSVRGSFKLNDPAQIYSHILRVNAQILLSWGYKQNGAPLESLFSSVNADLFTDKLERRGLNVLVLNPAGQADDNGKYTFSCGFLSSGWFGSNKYKTYETGTKASVVAEILKNMGVSSQFVMFDNSTDSYSSESVERQSETDFQFLSRLAFEWRCIFQMGFCPDGTTYAMFYGYANADTAANMVALYHGSSIFSSRMAWKVGDPGDLMCLSYSWNNEQGENGEGDNVNLVYVNGVPTYERFTIDNDTVTTWVLDTAKVKSYVDAGGSLSAVMQAVDFEDKNIKQFWVPAKQTTAPNGLGYTVKIHMLGNPAVVLGSMMTFNEKSFPSVLCRKEGSPVRFIVRKIDHTIGQNGYFMDLEVVDLDTISAVHMNYGNG
jgi:hypothetical protein